MDFRKWVSILVASLGVFFFAVTSLAEKAPYNSFAKDATSAAPSDYYDYIVIGGGTAGCAAASTLSAAARVVVLERGGLPYDNPGVTHLTGFLPTLADTSASSASQPFVSTDGVYNHRGRVLGGSSAINAGFYTRASSEYVEGVGWEVGLVEESYEWVEKKVAFRPAVRRWQAAVRDGLVEAGVSPYRGFTYEHLQGTKIGGSIFDEDGNRHSAADLLEYADPDMIRVYLHATVYQILFTTLPGQRPKAYGVVFSDSEGNMHKALLSSKGTSEIIVSAGALGSPQLLMLSGIGPAQHLMAQGIDVVLDQPMVGQGMSDNPMNIIPVPTIRPVETSLIEVVGIVDDDGCYIEAASGLLELPDLVKMAKGFAELANQTINLSRLKIQTQKSIIDSSTNIQAGLILEKIVGPYSTGYLELETIDPNENPKVTFNYFKDPRDLQRCVKGIEIIKRVVESEALASLRYPFVSFESLMDLMKTIPNNLRSRHSTDSSLEQFCIDTVMSIWHYHGGCQVDRVVDRDYRVLGVDSLRVVDGSTFYNSPGTNPQATLMMLGRYMGQKILQEHQSKVH